MKRQTKRKGEGKKEGEEGNGIKNKDTPHRPTTTAPKKQKTENLYLI
jgi:hypothetical protein